MILNKCKYHDRVLQVKIQGLNSENYILKSVCLSKKVRNKMKSIYPKLPINADLEIDSPLICFYCKYFEEKDD